MTIRHVSMNNEDILVRLIDTYQKLIFSICYKITGDYFTAEDLAQETFITAYEKYDTFDGTNEKAWICRIAINKSIDYTRSVKRRAVPVEDEYLLLAEDTGVSVENICIEGEIKEKLLECCKNLKPPYNAIATEYFLYKKNAAEIASEKKLNVKTVQTQIYRAREMLRRVYGKEVSA